MAGKSFAMTFPEKTACTVGQMNVPESPVRVGGLITVVVTPGMPLDPEKVDTRGAAILKAFFDEGVRSVAIENAEGPLDRSDILGPKSNALIQARKIRLVGVDRLADIAEMRAIQGEAMQKAPQYLGLFQAVEGLLVSLLAKLPTGAFAELFALRMAKDGPSSNRAVEVRQLFALERRFGRSIPADARRLLRGVELTEQIDWKLMDGELEELKRRMGERVRSGVLADDAETRLPNPDAKPAKPIRMQTGTGVVVLSAIQADLLRHCRELVDGLKTGMIPMSFYQMMARQKPARNAPAGLGQLVVHAVERNQSIQDYIADTAEVLGIDLDDYPTLRRVLQQSRMLAGATQQGFLDAYLQAFQKAWSHLEGCLAAGERELLAVVGKARELRKLASLEITPDEYSELSAELPDYRLGDVLVAVASHGIAVDAAVKAAAKEFDAGRSRLLAFYDRARQRARQMASRTLDFAKEDGGQALLVCLGFHQPAVLAAWRAARVSHLVVMPDLTAP